MFSLDESDAAHVFYIAEAPVWQASAHATHYVPSAFANEGFIHLSYARQVRATAARHYAGRTDLFSHLYAPLARDAVNALVRIHGVAPSILELRALLE